MRALITGAGGFVGNHLAAFLHHNTEFELYGSLIPGEKRPQLEQYAVTCRALDLRDPAAVDHLLAEVRPDRIYHLAGQAFVPRSFEDPWETIETNVRIPLNIFEGLRKQKLTEARVLVIGSAEVYGTAAPELMPLKEDAPLVPNSPYSVSKAAQDLLALQFYLSYRLFIVRVRPFNHIGPGQNNRFAIPAFASQIARIELGQTEPVVQVGDLTAERDFTDVRDIVRAYYLALESGKAGAVYNVCSGVARRMQDVLNRLISLSSRSISVTVDPARLRPVEIPRLFGDYAALRAQTGWQPQIDFEQTLNDVLDDWRQQVRAAPVDPL